MGNLRSPVAAIRAKCLECCSGKAGMIKKCDTPECPLFPYRLGKNPRRQGVGGGIANFRGGK